MEAIIAICVAGERCPFFGDNITTGALPYGRVGFGRVSGFHGYKLVLVIADITFAYLPLFLQISPKHYGNHKLTIQNGKSKANCHNRTRANPLDRPTSPTEAFCRQKPRRPIFTPQSQRVNRKRRSQILAFNFVSQCHFSFSKLRALKSIKSLLLLP